MPAKGAPNMGRLPSDNPVPSPSKGGTKKLAPIGSTSSGDMETTGPVTIPQLSASRPLTHTGKLSTPETLKPITAEPKRRGELPKIDPAGVRGTTEVYRGSTNAAGVPILELVRKMEYENIISRDDRLALNEALYDPEKREQVIQAVRNVELGMNPRFSVKRLKALIHGNAAGAPKHRSRTANEPMTGSRKLMAQELAEALADVYMSQDPTAGQNNSNSNNNDNSANSGNNSVKNITTPGSPNKRVKKSGKELLPVLSPEASVETQDTIDALHRVLGDAPTYADVCSTSNVCAKIAANLRHYMAKVKTKKSRPRQLVVIVGGGSFNPLTRMHLRTFFVAKQFIEKQLRAEVLGALLSPAHASLVRHRYRTCASEIIPTAHRLAIAQLCVQESRWMSVDPWEVTRRCAMDYLSQLDHVETMLSQRFPNVNIKLFYLSKPNVVPKLSIQGMKKNGFSCICVCRAPESDYLRASLGSRSNGVIYIGEDTAIIDSSMDQVSAKKVRDKLKAGKDVEDLVGHAVNEYLIHHRIAHKVTLYLTYLFFLLGFMVLLLLDARRGRVD